MPPQLPTEFPFALPWEGPPAIVCGWQGLELAGMVCTGCGCTDARPCLEGGVYPCSWIGINRCSACGPEPTLEIP